MTDWKVTACGEGGLASQTSHCGKVFFFEKDVAALLPPPPPSQETSAPSLSKNDPKTLDLSLEIPAEDQEIVIFKQKLAFGCKVKKIPNSTKMGMQQLHEITLRIKGR